MIETRIRRRTLDSDPRAKRITDDNNADGKDAQQIKDNASLNDRMMSEAPQQVLKDPKSRSSRLRRGRRP